MNSIGLLITVVPWDDARLHVTLQTKNTDCILLHILKGFISDNTPMSY